MILKNCRVVKELCEGFSEEHVDIRIEDKNITEILPVNGNYEGEEVIDCTGKTVLPGLYDLHLHLQITDDLNWDHIKNATESELALKAEKAAKTFLAYGYTSLRDAGSIRGCVMVLRDRINAGELTGPSIQTPGMVLSPNTDNNPTVCSNYYGHAVNCADDMRREVRNTMASGADFIKILGCRSLPVARVKDFYGLGGPLFTEDEMQELKRIAAIENTYVAVHCCSTPAVESALDIEAHTIEHAQFWTDECTRKLVDHGMKSCLVPTLTICGFLGEEFLMAATADIRKAYDAGALIGWGTDNGEVSFLMNPASEFQLRSRVWGIPNTEILKQATINSAKINGTDNIRGSICVGKRADLAVFDGNPDEDFSVFSRPCAYVIKDGAVVAMNGFVKN